MISTSIASAYRAASVTEASTIGLVLALFERLHSHLLRAHAALECGAVQERSNALKQGFAILTQLQLLLDQEAGLPAHQMQKFYSYVRKQMLQVQFHLQASLLLRISDEVESVAAAWRVVEAEQNQQTSSGAAQSHGVLPERESVNLDCTA